MMLLRDFITPLFLSSVSLYLCLFSLLLFYLFCLLLSLLFLSLVSYFYFLFLTDCFR